MSGRFRRSRRRTWSRYNRSRYGSNRSSIVKRTRGNMRAANNQNDTSDVVINLFKSVDVGVSEGFTCHEYRENPGDEETIVDDKEEFKQGTCALNVYDLLRKSDFYQSYANMYDQFRITSVKVKITPTRWSSFDQQLSLNNTSIQYGYYDSELNTVPKSINYEWNAAYTANVNCFEIVDGEPRPVTLRVRNPAYLNPPVAEPNANRPLYVGVKPGVEGNDKYYVPGNGMYSANVNGNYNTIVATPIANVYLPNEADDDEPDMQKPVMEFPETINDTTKLSFVVSSEYLPTNISGMLKKEVNPGLNGAFIYPQAFTIVTAWDRSGLDPGQFKTISQQAYICSDAPYTYGFIKVPDALDYGSGDAEHFNVDNRYNIYYGAVCIGDDITSYSSAQTKQLVPGASFNCIRYLYPSSNQEKSIYYSTSSLHEQLKSVQDELPYLLESERDKMDTIKSTELCNLLSDPTIPFKPTFLLGVLGHSKSDIPNIDEIQVRDIDVKNCIKRISFNLEFDIGVTFRGLRKSQVV